MVSATIIGEKRGVKSMRRANIKWREKMFNVLMFILTPHMCLGNRCHIYVGSNRIIVVQSRRGATLEPTTSSIIKLKIAV